MAETSLEDSPALNRFAPSMNALGYRSAEQFLGTAAVAPDDLARYLKIDVATLQSIVAAIPHPARALAPHGARPRRGLGVRLDRIRHPAVASMPAPGAVAALPASMNLIADMQPIRDQGERGTCVAHSSAAVAEHYWRAQGQIVDLARQFLYWDCKQHDGDPTDEGTWIAIAMQRLIADGCCTEGAWPYVMTNIAGNESQDPAPPAAVAEAPTYKVMHTRQISATSVTDIKAALAESHCVAFSVPVFNSWYQNDEVTRTGEIINPIPGEANAGGHAMCLVGYQDLPDDSASGGGRFYLRNSWGAAWATESTLKTAGYGTIPYSYIAANCQEAYTIEA